jgi:uroporphyrinogen-III synthase
MTTILLPPSLHDDALAGELDRSSARVVRWPETSIVELEDNAALDEAFETLFGYDWLLFKNEFAVEFFLRRFQLQHTASELDALRILTTGAATEQRLVEASIHVDIALNRFSLTNVFAALKSYTSDQESLAGTNFLIASANITREHFEVQLEESGARVDNVAAYRTTLDRQRLAQMNALLLGGGIDCVVFPGPATVEDFARLVDTDDLPRVFADIKVVCGDPPTKEIADEFGLVHASVSALQSTATLASLTDEPTP